MAMSRIVSGGFVRGKRAGSIRSEFSLSSGQMNQSSSLAMVLPIHGAYCFIIVLVGLLVSAEVGAIVCKKKNWRLHYMEQKLWSLYEGIYDY